MRNSLSIRAARACAAGTLFLSLALTPAIAFAGPPAHAGIGAVHFASHGFRGFNRFRSGRFGFDRSGHNRFDFDRFGFNRFRSNRFGSNADVLDSGLLGLDGWGYPTVFPTAPAAPVVVGAAGPPVAINVYAGGGAGNAEAGGACVIHLLEYDKAGNYTGERQIPEC